MSKLTKQVISKRTIFQAGIGALLYVGVSYLQISLWWVLLGGIIIGGIFGKVFCRWMCPLGFFMELMMSISPGQKLQQMYMYHKVGCPIAWIEGALNKFSFIQIKVNSESCKNCGICDKECYITKFEPEKYSLYQPGKQRPGQSYTCSKCLSCVAVCPNGSLKYTGKADYKSLTINK